MENEQILKIQQCKENAAKIRDILEKELRSKIVSNIPNIVNMLEVLTEIKDDNIFADICTDFSEDGPFQVITASDMHVHEDDDKPVKHVLVFNSNLCIVDTGDIAKLSGSKSMYEKLDTNYLCNFSVDELLAINDSLNIVIRYMTDVNDTLAEICDCIDYKLSCLADGASIDDFINLQKTVVNAESSNIIENESVTDSDNSIYEDTVDSESAVIENDMTYEPVLDDIVENANDIDESNDINIDSANDEISNMETISDIESSEISNDNTVSFADDNDEEDIVEDDDGYPDGNLDAFDEEQETKSSLVATLPKNVVNQSTKRTSKNRILPMRATGKMITLTIDINWIPDFKSNKHASFYDVFIPIVDSRKDETINFMIDARFCKYVDSKTATISLDTTKHYAVYYPNDTKDNLTCDELIQLCQENI